MSAPEQVHYLEQTVERIEGLLITQLDKLQVALQASNADNLRLQGQKQPTQYDERRTDTGTSSPREAQ
jgi:hypothetical protein